MSGLYDVVIFFLIIIVGGSYLIINHYDNMKKACLHDRGYWIEERKECQYLKEINE